MGNGAETMGTGVDTHLIDVSGLCPAGAKFADRFNAFVAEDVPDEQIAKIMRTDYESLPKSCPAAVHVASVFSQVAEVVS